jgi:hypothetical protein
MIMPSVGSGVAGDAAGCGFAAWAAASDWVWAIAGAAIAASDEPISKDAVKRMMFPPGLGLLSTRHYA